MKKLTYYQCETCGEQYPDAESALECEKQHIKPARLYERMRYRYFSPAYRGCFRYPRTIHVEMEDGEIVSYYYDRVEKNKDEKKEGQDSPDDNSQ